MRGVILMLLVVLGMLLSPLRAVAATTPVLFAYDAAVRPAATTVVGGYEAVGSETERPAFNDYDCAHVGYDAPSNPHVAIGAAGVHAYDAALELLERREAVGGAIYGVLAVTAAAEAGGLARGVENIATFDSLVEARAAARTAAGLGEDAVPYTEKFGPYEGRVTGMQSPDGLRAWRVDFDTSKGYHVNWWDRTGGAKRAMWQYGANVIEGGTQDTYWQFMQHVP